jgi:hypothetical protein
MTPIKTEGPISFARALAGWVTCKLLGYKPQLWHTSEGWFVSYDYYD